MLQSLEHVTRASELPDRHPDISRWSCLVPPSTAEGGTVAELFLRVAAATVATAQLAGSWAAEEGCVSHG